MASSRMTPSNLAVARLQKAMSYATVSLRSRRQLMAGPLDYARTQNPELGTPLKRRMASKINTNGKSLNCFCLVHIAHLLCLI